ncbi:JmjC domain, hydroxylase-domain-containing protein, partial [Phakopsora pachyrhizi]
MTQPWIYVGMVFSTFAWHKEDHYTYSINYHHWGDTKTWYGVPGEDDGKLEEAMKMAAPELFEQQPDLMFQLVTLMSPGRLKRAGVRTYVCDQRPNEFVITCPRSYHSGFNHGFNLNEAVNFCLPDWLNEGSLCVKHYKALSKMPVFSHDELLVTIFNNEKSPRVSRWLLPHFKEMVEREIAERKSAIGHISNLSPDIIIEPSDLPEDQVQCHHCKTFTFLSQVISLDSPKVSCLDHSHILGNTQKKLRYKFSDDELQAMLLRVNSRSIKAGRILDMSSIEQRTSTRKRKPSAALLEATRAVLPMAQKMKTSHTSLHRDAQSDTSTQMDNSLSAAREESLEHEEDERAERLIMVSETGLRGVFRTKAEEMRSEVVKEEQVTESSLPNESRNSRSASRSAPPPIPSRENPKSLEQPQLAKPGSQVLPKNLSPPNQSTPSAPFSSLIAQKSSNSSTGPGSRRTDAPNVMDKRRVGRPPKTAEVRAAEAEARRAMREAALHDKEAQHKPINSTPGKRAQVVAQIDVGGSASIVQLSPGAQRPTLEPLKSSPLRIAQTSQGSRKGKQKSSVSSAPPSKNLSQTIDPSRIPTPPSKTGPSTNERPRQNVIRIKSHNRIGSHPAEPKTVVKQVDDPIPHSKSSTQPYSQTCIGTPSRLHGNQFQEAIPDYSGKSRQVVLTSSPKPHPSIAAPLDVLPGTRSPTPSSLMSILNPIAMDPVTSFE